MKTSIFSFRIFIISLVIVSLWGLGFFLFTMKNPWNDIQQDGANSAMPSAETIDDYLNNPENNKDPDFMVAKNALENGDIKNAPILWEKIVKKQEDIQKLTSDDILKPKIVPRILLAQSYLQYGNYYHKEKEYADKAIQIISKDGDDDYGAHGMYFVGYAYEITKQYDKALEWYEKGLKVSSNTDRLKSVFKNQIGHVYHLQWNLDKAYEFYMQAYELNKTNTNILMNLGRSLVRMKKIPEALVYFEQALLYTKEKLLKAEIDYDIASLYMFMTGDRESNLKKSLEYAKRSVQDSPRYPLWYVGEARVYIMKWENLETAESLLKKSLALYPNLSVAYEWLGLLEQWKWVYSASITHFLKSLELIDKDIILMDNERVSNAARVHYFLAVSLALWKNKAMAVKELNEMLVRKDGMSLSLLLNEIKKPDYWYFKELKGYPDFEKIAALSK